MCYRWKGDTLLLTCKVQPGSSDTRIAGEAAEALRIRLSAAPTDGKANRQLVKLLANQFQVKLKAITIVSGASSRRKLVRIDNPVELPDFIDPDQL